MKKKVLGILLGVMFVAEVMMTLFNFDIFARFIKEKRKMNEEKIKQARVSIHNSGRYPWNKED